MPEHMNTDVLTVIGLVIGGLGVAVAAVSGAVGAFFGYRAVVAGRQAVAEARTARREEHLYRDLERLERLAGLLKRMWAIFNRPRVGREPATSSSPDLAAIAGQEMDALLYDLRAVLMMFDRDELPRCTHLVESFDGRRLLVNGQSISDAETEVVATIARCREALRALA
jgi:hypothetical protein